MRTLVLPVYRRCNQACVFCAVADELDGSPVPPASLREAIDGARARGFDSVCLTGGEPTLAPQLIRALAYAHGIGLHTAISTNGRLLADVEKVKRLEATGLDAVHVALHAATPGVHQDLTGGDPIAHEQVVTALRHCVPRFHTTVRMVLTTRNLDEVTGVCALARELGVHRVDLRCVRHEGATASGLVPTPQQALDAWRTAWSAWAQPGGDFAWHGFRSVSPAEATPQPPSTPARDRLALLEAGLVDEALLGGLSDVEERLAPELVAATGVGRAQLAGALAARRTPAVVGGTVAAPAAVPALGEDDQVVVVVDRHTPPWIAASTLPALVHTLQQEGVEARLASVYGGTFDTRSPLPAEAGGLRRVTGLLRAARPRLADHPDQADGELLDAGQAQLERSLDLVRATVAVVHGRATARWLRARPEARHLRLVLLDDEDGPLPALADGDVVRSPFPAAHRGLLRDGVDLGRLRWRPLPLWTPHLPALARTRDLVLLGGGASVDPTLLPAGAGERGLRAWPGTEVDGVEALPDRVASLCEALPRVRAVWLPVRGGPGLDPLLVSFAVALGLPLITTPAARPTDVLRPGRGAVAEATVAAQHAALARLDDAQVAAWTVPAPEAVGIDQLAAELVRGAARPMVVPSAPGEGPWWGWPA